MVYKASFGIASNVEKFVFDTEQELKNDGPKTVDAEINEAVPIKFLRFMYTI
jgi:hypothetical protein